MGQWHQLSHHPDGVPLIMGWWPCGGCGGGSDPYCSQCDSGTRPTQVQAVVSGFAYQSPTSCFSWACTQLNGTKTLTQNITLDCQWTYSYPSTFPCGGNTVNLYWTGSAWEMSVVFTWAGSPSLVVIKYSPTGSISSDCSTWSSEPFAYASDNITSAGDCNVGSSSILITSL